MAGDLQLERGLGRAFRLGIAAGLQTSFGKAMLSSEQFSLEGLDAVAGFVPGELAVDEGGTIRCELSRTTPVHIGRLKALFIPYLFTGAGIGRLAQPTVVEARDVRAAGVGGGVRWRQTLWEDGPQLSAGLEYASAYVNRPAGGARHSDRISASAAISF